LRPENLKTYASELAKFKDRVQVVLDSLSSELVQGQGPLASLESSTLKNILGVFGDWMIQQGLAKDQAQV
jgi:hypothetical protein